jgi:hypothetical protein
MSNKPRKKRTSTSSRGKKSAKKSTPNSEYKYDEVVDGLRVELERSLLHKKSICILVPEDQIRLLKKEDIITVSDPQEKDLPPPEEYPKAPERGDDEDDEAFAAKTKSWENGKVAWEEAQAKKPPLKQVNMWTAIYHVTKATIDGYLFKAFHTVRGPMVGLVLSETSNTVTLYSPAYIDPNIQSGRVHFLPIAFAGYQLTLHKPCFGESIPDQPVCLGYPAFIKQNQQGDYVLRSKSAYHVVDADIDLEAETVSVDVGVRSLLEGALVTSDGRQPKEISQAKALKAVVEEAKAAPAIPPETSP